MKDIKTDRRSFFKKAGAFLSGAIAFSLGGLFPKTDPTGQKQTSLKEAMHYKTDDTLAG